MHFSDRNKYLAYLFMILWLKVISDLLSLRGILLRIQQ